MPFTAQLGVALAELANIELGLHGDPLNVQTYLEYHSGPPMPGSPLMLTIPIGELANLFSAPPPPKSGAAQIQPEYHSGPPMPGTPLMMVIPIGELANLGFTKPAPPPPPPPPMGRAGTNIVPLIPRDTDPRSTRRARKATEDLSQMINSLRWQGYLARPSYSPLVWRIPGTAEGAAVTVNGPTSGTVIFNQAFVETNYKRVMIYVKGLTGTVSYTFPTPFTHTPQIISQSLAGIVTALSATAVTLTGSASTGFIELSGF